MDINPDIPPELSRITLKAMRADITERYQSAKELLTDLEAFRRQRYGETLLSFYA